MTAALKIEVQSVGDGKVVADLERLAIRAEDVLPVWPVLDGLFHVDEEQRFERQGPGWKRLADATVEKKAQLGQSPKIMRATGELQRSLTTAATGAEESRPTRLVFGTDVSYARFHQYGTVNMPKRKVVGISAATQKEMVRVLTEFVARGIP